MFQVIKKIRPSFIQPILTIVLIVLVGFLIYRDFGGDFFKTEENNSSEKVELKEVDFETIYQNYLENNFEIYTRGYFLAEAIQEPNKNFSQDPAITSTPEIDKNIEFIRQSYDNHFFYVEKGKVIRLNKNEVGSSTGIISLSPAEVYLVSDDKASYIECKPSGEEITNLSTEDFNELCLATYETVQDIFPLSSLLIDYKDGKFNPIKKATNVYEGLWSHPKFTEGQSRSIIIQLDGSTQTIKRIRILSRIPEVYSEVTFDFKVKEDLNSYKTIPEGYKKIDLDTISQ